MSRSLIFLGLDLSCDWLDLPVVPHNVQEMLEPIIPMGIPMLAHYFSFSWNANAFCWGLSFFHVLEYAVTDFGPGTSGGKLFINTPLLNNYQHRVIDSMLTASLVSAMCIYPDHFGPFPRCSAFVLFLLLVAYFLFPNEHKGSENVKTWRQKKSHLTLLSNVGS
jgi:hypothetical protein